MEKKDLVTLLAEPFLDALHRLSVHVPETAAALLLLLAGMFTARALRTVAERLCEKAALDDYTRRVGINEVLSRLGLGKSPSYALSFLVYWFIVFVFIVSAANAVNMTVVSELLERFALFLPALIAALLILFGGLLFARFISQIIANAAAANSIRGGDFLAEAAYATVVVFAAMTALEQLGLKLVLLSSVLQIVLASAGLAAGLAFGLGGKDAAAEIIRAFLSRRKD